MECYTSTFLPIHEVQRRNRFGITVETPQK